MRYLMIVLVIVAIKALAVCAADIYVSPAGDDSSGGTVDKPLRTLGAAQILARRVKGTGAVTIHLRGGVYYLPETLVLTSEDSGTKAGPVVWTGDEGGNVVISGGVKLEPHWTAYKNGGKSTKGDVDDISWRIERGIWIFMRKLEWGGEDFYRWRCS